MGLSLTNQSASAPSAKAVCLLDLHKGAGLRAVSSAARATGSASPPMNTVCVLAEQELTEVRIFLSNDSLIKL